MGDPSTSKTMKVAFVLVAVCLAQAMAMPMNGDVELLDEVSGLMPNGDDEATVEAEVDKDIQADVDKDDMGESTKLSKGATDWEKNTVAAINGMSDSEIKKNEAAPQDKLSAQFAADVANAEKVMKAPKAKKSEKLKIEQEANAALDNPAAKKELKKLAAKAELDISSVVIPDSLIQKAEQDNLGEDDLDDNLKLVSGSDADIMKQINEQIGQSVSAQLGEGVSKTKADTSQPQLMNKFEQDAQEASKFLMNQKKGNMSKSTAKAQIKADLANAQHALGEAQEGTH